MQWTRQVVLFTRKKRSCQQSWVENLTRNSLVFFLFKTITMAYGNRIKKDIYLTPDEMKYVEMKQKEYGYNFSRLARYALLHLDDTSAKKKIEVCSDHNAKLEERKRELAAIGNNINQIAHQVNIFAIDGLIPEEYVVKVIIPEIENIRQLLSKIDTDQILIKKRLYT